MLNGMRRWAVFALLLSSVALSGCDEIKVSDGKIPEKYLPTAWNYVGVYDGKMDGIDGELRLAIDNENRAVLSFQNESGDDLIDPRCRSRIGKLLAVRVDEDKGAFKLKGARFAFHPNRCVTIDGRDVALSFKEKGGLVQVSVSILEETRMVQDCQTTVDGRGVPRTICTSTPFNRYLTGRFLKR